MTDPVTDAVQYVDKDLLFKEALPEEDVSIPGKGTVRVRGLTRAEVMACQTTVKEGPGQVAATERKMIAKAMLRPEMTEAEVGRWQKSSTAGEMEPVTHAVQRLSGMTDEAAKEAYREFDQDPDAEFRVPAG